MARPVHRSKPTPKIRILNLAETVSDEESQFSVSRLMDLENQVWEMQEDLMRLCDEVESKEPLQAKQTFNIIADRIGAIGEYINNLTDQDKQT